MPRTLPWQVKTESRGSSASRTSGIREKSRKSRSSSISPPQGRDSSPASEPLREEYMREGFENDDIYVMVEDEFLATAGTFTRHLHEAEYARRKKLARIQNATTIGDLSRPTDPKAEMSTERKMNHRAKSASMKHKAALDQVKNDAGRPQVDSELEGDEDADEGDDPDDPWIGTQLQTLMTSPRKSRSLVGLQGVKSTTRAALGFAGLSSHAAPNDSRPAVVSGNHTASRQQKSIPAIEIGGETSSGDDDDLGMPSKHKAPKVEKSIPSVVRDAADKPGDKPGSSRRPVLERRHDVPETSSSAAVRAHATPAYKSRITKLFDDIDDKPAPMIKNEIRSPKKGDDKQLAPESTLGKPQARDHKSRRDRLNQVPTFL